MFWTLKQQNQQNVDVVLSEAKVECHMASSNFASLAIIAKFKSKLASVRKNEPNKPVEKTLSIWANHTTFHSVIDWFVSKHWASFIFWSVLFVVFIGIAFYQVVGLFTDFSKYPHYTSNTYVEENQFPDFPNVTVCSFNRVDRGKAEALGLTSDAIMHLFWAQMQIYELSYDSVPQLKQKGKEAWAQYKADPSVPAKLKDPYELLKHLGHSCNDTMVTCLFGGKKFTCCSNVIPILNSEYGLCLVLNPPKEADGSAPKQKMPGISGGMRFYYNNRLDLYLNDNMSWVNNFLERGILVIPNYNPYQMSYLNPIALNLGTHARITLSTTVIKYTKPKVTAYPAECVDDGKLAILAGPYDRSNCIKDCFQKFVLHKCGCTFVSERKTNDRTCDGDDVTFCLGSVAEIYNTKDADEQKILSDCMNNCKNPCAESQDVSAITYTSDFPSPFYIPHTMQLLAQAWPGITEENAYGAMAIDLFYTERGYSIVERVERYSVFQLISNIGGQMALWLGASLITLIQVVYYLFYGLCRMLKKSEKEPITAIDNDDSWIRTRPPSRNYGQHKQSAEMPPGTVRRASQAPPSMQEIYGGGAVFGATQRQSWNRSTVGYSERY